MDDTEDFTDASLGRLTGSQSTGSQSTGRTNPADFFEANMEVNDDTPAVLAFGTPRTAPARPKKKGKKRSANVGEAGDGVVAGSQHQQGTIGLAAQKPKLDAHIHVDPTQLVGFKQVKHEKKLYGGFRYNFHSTLKSGVKSYECEVQRDGCRGRLWVYPDGSCEVRKDHSIHSANNTKSKVVKVSYFTYLSIYRISKSQFFFWHVPLKYFEFVF